MATDLGTKSCSSPSRLATKSAAVKTTPVTLPPGWLRLATTPLSHRIATANEDDRNRCGCGHHRATCQNIPDDDGRLPTNEIGCQLRQPIRLIVAPTIVDS